MAYLVESKNPSMQKVFEIARKVAPSSSTVLILGESGTGKEILARYIHFCSKRKGPFVAVNCAAIPEELLEAELFGYEKGAFTGATRSKPGKFELANEGTLFLDEIGDLSLKLQAKLLRVLQEKTVERLGGERPVKVNVRILAATNKNLEEEVRKGNFREDLYFRLKVIPIKIPPLRERKEDIPAFVEFFLKKICEREGLEPKKISPEGMEFLINYHWPGNVRELENFIERLVILTDSQEISLEEIKRTLFDDILLTENEFNFLKTKEELSKGEVSKEESPGLSSEDVPMLPKLDESGIDLNQVLKDVEIYYLKKALSLSDGVKTKAARLLGLNRTTFLEKLKRYNLL